MAIPTTKDMQFALAVFNNMKSKPDVDWKAVALQLNLKNAATANTRFSQIKKKFNEVVGNTPTKAPRAARGIGTNKNPSKVKKASPKSGSSKKAVNTEKHDDFFGESEADNEVDEEYESNGEEHTTLHQSVSGLYDQVQNESVCQINGVNEYGYFTNYDEGAVEEYHDAEEELYYGGESDYLDAEAAGTEGAKGVKYHEPTQQSYATDCKVENDAQWYKNRAWCNELAREWTQENRVRAEQAAADAEQQLSSPYKA